MFWTFYIKISFPPHCRYSCEIEDLGFVVPYVQQKELSTVDCGALAIWKYNHDCGTLT